MSKPKSRKPQAVEEPAVAYQAAVPAHHAPGGMRHANAASVRETNRKLMQVHREVLQKLAR